MDRSVTNRCIRFRVTDGRDDSGRRVGAGTYFVRVQAGEKTQLVKVLLAR